MVTGLIILIFVALAWIAGKVWFSMQFSREVNQLFAESAAISTEKFSYEKLDGLPEPVQRYFRHVLKEGQPYINYVRLQHHGRFKTSPKSSWMTIKGEQYFTTRNPGFVWKGSTKMFTATDMFLGGKGRLVVALLSAFKIADGKGEKYDQGELLRWLGESVWFPTNLLPDENLHWAAIDDRSAQLTYKYKHYALEYQVVFNPDNEISELKTRRYMGSDNLETWVGKVSDYKELNGIKVPTTIEAFYMLKEGEYGYAKFLVDRIEYENPQKFD